MKLYFVTSNFEKVNEFNRILDGKIEIEHLKPKMEIKELVDQDIEKVVCDKAKKMLEIYKRPIIAEDTGFFINALDGFPGCLINRETKKHGGKYDYWCNLLNEKGIEDRSTQVKTAIAVCKPRKEPLVYVGIIQGSIPEKPKGKFGFGWDNIFIPDGYNKTFSELGTEIKDKISMRKMALENFLGDIKNIKKYLDENS